MLQLWWLWTLVSQQYHVLSTLSDILIGNQNAKAVGEAHCLHQEEEGHIEKTEMTDSVLIADPIKDPAAGIMMTGEWAAVIEDRGK